MAGTGTAMGTGGYYYSPSSHWVVFPQFEIHRAKMPCGSSRNEFFRPENLFKQKAT